MDLSRIHLAVHAVGSNSLETTYILFKLPALINKKMVIIKIQSNNWLEQALPICGL